MFYQQKNQSPNRTTILNQQTTLLRNSRDDQSLGGLKDSLISLEYRIKTLQSQINGKMQRQECHTLLQRKSNTSYVKKCFEQIYTKIQADKQKQESNYQKIQQQQKKKINDLKKKLKQVNNTRQGTQFGSSKDNLTYNLSSQSLAKKINKAIVKPQQLYLESNETMFSMLIDEIKELKQTDTLIQRLIESKHKKNISLNNQVCRKLEHLQNQLQQTIKYIDTLQSKNNSCQNESKKPVKKSTSKSQKQNQQIMERFDRNLPQSQAFQTIRLQLLSKSMQGIQRQLSQKLNIKDVIPLIKQNVPTFQDSLQQIKSYVQENFDSMRKILQNQSQINQEISKSNRVAWWHCYQKLDFQSSQRSSSVCGIGYIFFSKQIMNIIPQNLIVEKDEQQTLKILTKGWYLVHVYGLDIGNESDELRNNQENINVWIEVNNGNKHPVHYTKLLNLMAGSQLRVITSKQDLFVQVQKL